MALLAVLYKGVLYKPYLVSEGRDVAKTLSDLRTARPSRCCGGMAPGSTTFFYLLAHSAAVVVGQSMFPTYQFVRSS